MKNRRSSLTLKHGLISLTVLCFVLMVFTWETRDSVSPIEKTFSYVIIPVNNGVNSFGDWLVDRIQFMKNINEFETLNENLQQEVEQLRYDNIILEQSRVELDRLRSLYDLDQMYADFPKTGAQIIGKDPGNWYDIFVINKGENDGLAVNMVVLAGEGLVGHITEVGPNYAKVQSIINDSNHVSAKSIRTSDLCIVNGDLTMVVSQAYCFVDKISDQANIIVGDDIITSHLSDIYPEGILIGTITEITDNDHKMTKTAVLKPVVDFMHLEEVLVIKQVFQLESEGD
ncbi:MAG: rod shape-determining protein MreC [Vallitaleaceae bacterium]|jgi:rod shape-determining protein MreC|nr:rod shape-determining protein MreC [Vallitaleaceae bacterium]